MPEPLTREQMYKAVWSEPLKTLSERFGVSDVALAKACRKANIPVPERGYWAKKQAGKPAIQPVLPPRFPGEANTVEVGNHQSSNYWHRELINEPLPPQPVFSEELGAVRERVVKMVGKVPCPQPTSQSHPLIRKLLDQDEVRKRKYEESLSWWDEPWFATHIDKRRLRIMNALFLAMQKLGCKPSITTSQYAKDNREASFRVANSHITVTVKIPEASGRGKPAPKDADKRLCLTIQHSNSATTERRYWEDSDEGKVEDHLSEIVTEILMTAEIQLRETAKQYYQWIVERKAKLEDEERKRKIEAERKAQELRTQHERERVERLIGQAESLKKSDIIRDFVATIRGSADELPVPRDAIERWATWALAEADRIDPRLNITFLEDA